MITIPSLNDVTDIADSDVVMITNSQGESFKLAGSEINKRGKIIIANGTTITGAPLKAGSSVRVYFTVDLTAANASTTLQLNYNNVNYYVKAPKDGTLINFVATNLGGSPAVYKYLQKYTTLELLFDGTQFVIIGNPVILSSADYTIYADGLQRVNSVTKDNKNLVTSNAVYHSIKQIKNYIIEPNSSVQTDFISNSSAAGEAILIIASLHFSTGNAVNSYCGLLKVPYSGSTISTPVLIAEQNANDGYAVKLHLSISIENGKIKLSNGTVVQMAVTMIANRSDKVY